MYVAVLHVYPVEGTDGEHMHLYFVLKNVQCHCTCTSDCAVRVVIPVLFVHLCAVCVVWYLIILYSLYATRHPSVWYSSICSLASVHICAIICSCLHFLFAYQCPCCLFFVCVCVFVVFFVISKSVWGLLSFC